MTCRVIGIDVAGKRRGFHGVFLEGDRMESFESLRAEDMAAWSRKLGPAVIAIDSPCLRAASGKSRLAETSLRIGGCQIQCFRTPTMEIAGARPFYDWVRNGMKLYDALASDFPLYRGGDHEGPVTIETFPQAVACHLAGCLVSARGKARVRRAILAREGLNERELRNIDYVDAALCALAARAYAEQASTAFGRFSDGFIVVPLGSQAARV